MKHSDRKLGRQLTDKTTAPVTASPVNDAEFCDSHLFIRVHNEPLPIVAVCVNNPDRSPVGINRLIDDPDRW